MGSADNPDRPFASSWRRQRLTVAERVARGKAARREVPRSGHAGFSPAPDRPDPIAVLEAQGAGRVPELLPIRYGRMLVSPFTFYRGAAAIMAFDLGGTPRSGVTVQLCGDAHLSNFGLFGTPERQMLFDINDFDETLPGPWEWDVKRLAASFEVMGRARGFSGADRRAVVVACVHAYRQRMREAAAAGTLEVWYEHLEAGQLLEQVAEELRKGQVGKKDAATVQKSVVKARTRDSVRVLTRHAAKVDGELRIVADPPLIVPIEDLVTPGSEWERSDVLIKELLASYRRTLGVEHHPLEEFRYVHAARKVVGVGSVGTRCYIILLIGRDDEDPLILQVKEAQASVLEPFVGESRPSPSRAAGRCRAAPHAGGNRHLPGLAEHHRFRRRDPRLLPPPTPRLERQRRRRALARAGSHVVRPTSAERPLRAPTRVGATGSRSRRTWAGAIRSTRRSPTSLPRTPTRTSATTKRSCTPCRPVGSSPRPGSSVLRAVGDDVVQRDDARFRVGSRGQVDPQAGRRRAPRQRGPVNGRDRRSSGSRTTSGSVTERGRVAQKCVDRLVACGVANRHRAVGRGRSGAHPRSGRGDCVRRWARPNGRASRAG